MSEAERQANIIRRMKTETAARPIRWHKGGAAVPVTPPLPWVGMLCRGGNTVITTPSAVYGIKRFAGEAKAGAWYSVNRKATATAGVTAGAITSITLTDCGAGYLTLPSVTVGGPGIGAVITPTIASAGDRVEGVYLTACGSGYTFANVAFTAAPGGGVTAAGTAVLRDGKVVAITLTNVGRGYLVTPAVTITGDGAAAAATAVRVAGALTLAITTPGTGHTTAPTITVGAPPIGVTPAPPSPAAPANPAWSDGVGWGTINGGSLTGGITAGAAALIVHDDRAMVAYGLMGDGAGSAPYSRAPDSILSWYQTLVRLSIADANADGVLSARVPMGGGV